MVKGQFDSHGQPFLPVELTGLHGTISLQALIDTGFDGDLCVPLAMAMTIGLELKDADYVELADGSIHRELIFRGTVRVGDLAPKEGQIVLTNSEQPLIGAGMFERLRLEIDYGAATVALKSSRKRARR
jgi:clan AA aspartic protease